MPIRQEKESESDKIHGDKLEDLVDRAAGSDDRKRGQQAQGDESDDESELEEDEELEIDEDDEE